jgi:hypothetical protein
MSIHKIYDTIIIGGGIAGLYAFYKLQKSSPESKIILLERSPRRDLGGRAGTHMFHGVPLAIGAGIGRAKKDHLLQKLMKEIGIPIHYYKSRRTYGENLSCDVRKTFSFLKEEYKKDPRDETFWHFATRILGADKYKDFLVCSGYTDYENEHVHNTLYYYGFDDNFGGLMEGFSVPWGELIHKLAKKVGSQNILCNSDVIGIHGDVRDGFSVMVETPTIQKTYMGKQIIIATTVDSVRTLLPKATIFKQIQGQPFLRVYGKFSKASIPVLQEKVPGFTVVSGPLQKIIPMSPEKGVYMIAYCDNHAAVSLKRFLENTEKNRAFFVRLLCKALGVKTGEIELQDMIPYFWQIGTHYYPPMHGEFKSRKDFIKQAQHPMEGVVVVGEMISMKQGWVEGALESVESGLGK